MINLGSGGGLGWGGGGGRGVWIPNTLKAGISNQNKAK